MDLIHSKPGSYAGLWMDHLRGGLLVVAVTAGPSYSNDYAAIRASLVAGGADMKSVEFVQSSKSMAQLDTEVEAFMKDEVPQLAQDGYVVSSVGRLAEKDTIRVGVVGLTDAQKSDLGRRYPSVEFLERGKDAEADYRTNSGGQWKSELSILPSDASGNPTGPGCTSGVFVKNATNKFLLTAGHCVGAYWHHIANSAYPSVDTYFAPGQDGDLQVIDVPDFMTSTTALGDGTSSSADTTFGASVLSTRTWSANGHVVCASAATQTTWRCGTVTDDDYNPPDGPTNLVHATMFEANDGALPGDSGGGIMMNLTNPSPGVYHTGSVGVTRGFITGTTNTITFTELGIAYARMQADGYGAVSALVSPVYVPLQVGSGMCMDVLNALQGDSVELQQYTCAGSPNQLFKVVPRNNTYGLVAQHSGKCVDVRTAGVPIGRFQQFTCNNTNNQRFALAHVSVDLTLPDFQLVAQHSFQCAQVASTAIQAKINQQPCSPGGSLTSQRWKHY